MAAMEQFTARDLGPGLEGLDDSFLDDIKDRAMAEARKAAWRWYEANKELVLLSKRIVFWTVKVTVEDCREILEMIVGPKPSSL